MSVHLTPNKDWRAMADQSQKRASRDQLLLDRSFQYGPSEFQRFHNQLSAVSRSTNLATMKAVWNDCDYMRNIFRLDTFQQNIYLMRRLPWESRSVDNIRVIDDGLAIEIVIGLQEVQHEKMTKDMANDLIDHIALSSPFDSAQDRLFAHWELWDGYDHIHRFAIDYFGHTGNETDAAMVAKVMECFFCQMVHRILDPGHLCLAELVPILHGDQGLRKTLMYPHLVLDPYWYTTQLPQNLRDKDAKQHLAGKMLVVLPEMAHFTFNRMTVIKDWISTKVDIYRPPYGRRDIIVPRRCVFISEGNQFAGLDDPTGGRRFYPIEIKQEIPLLRLDANRAAIMAQALHLYMAHRNNDTGWWLTREDDAKAYEIRSNFRDKTLYDDEVARFVEHWISPTMITDDKGVARVDANYHNTPFKTSVVEEFIWGSAPVLDKPSRNRERYRILEALRFAGFTSIQVNVKPYLECKRDQWTVNSVWVRSKPSRSTFLSSEIVHTYVPHIRHPPMSADNPGGVVITGPLDGSKKPNGSDDPDDTPF